MDRSLSFTIETERLVLRPMTTCYLDEYLALRSDPEIARYLRPRDRVALLERVRAGQDSWEGHGYGPFAVIDSRTGEFRGRINVQRRAETDEIELGWIFNRESWGRGFATEAVRAVITWCFEALEVSYVTAFIRPANASSRRVAARVGMTLLRSDVSDGTADLVFAVSAERTA